MNRLITILFLGMTAIIMQAKTDNEQLTNEARAEDKFACTMPCKEKSCYADRSQSCNSICFRRRTSHLEVAASFQPFQGRRQVVFYICTCFEILKRTTITRRFADYMHFGEFPFELSAVISKCDFVISDTIF